MAHEIHDVDTAIFAVTPAWHGLGTVLPAQITNADEAYRASGLDWEVGLRPLYAMRDATEAGMVPVDLAPNRATEEAMDDDERRISAGIPFDQAALARRLPETGRLIELPAREVVRLDNGRHLGVVGPDWRPLQNKDLFQFFAPMLEQKLGAIDTAGSLRGNQVVWALMALHAKAEVMPGDEMCCYQLVSNAHNTTRRVRFCDTDIRVVCANTLKAADDSGIAVALRHTTRVQERFADLSLAVAEAIKRFEDRTEIYRAFSKVILNDEARAGYLAEIFPDPPLPRSNSRAKKMRERILQLHEDGRGANTVRGIRGTLWGLFQAIVEQVDHGVGRGVDKGKVLDSAWFGHGADIKRAAYNLAIEAARQGGQTWPSVKLRAESIGDDDDPADDSTDGSVDTLDGTP